eukprot:11711328-Alexandrium_andersonii.AAC.1
MLWWSAFLSWARTSALAAASWARIAQVASDTHGLAGRRSPGHVSKIACLSASARMAAWESGSTDHGTG